jgi:hypothetical protein
MDDSAWSQNKIYVWYDEVWPNHVPSAVVYANPGAVSGGDKVRAWVSKLDLENVPEIQYDVYDLTSGQTYTILSPDPGTAWGAQTSAEGIDERATEGTAPNQFLPKLEGVSGKDVQWTSSEAFTTTGQDQGLLAYSNQLYLSMTYLSGSPNIDVYNGVPAWLTTWQRCGQKDTLPS